MKILKNKRITLIKPHELRKELLYLSGSRPKKMLFDHLPKCGGSSLNVFLDKHYLKRKTFSMNPFNQQVSVDEFKTKSQQERHEYDLIKGHGAYKLIGHAHPESLKVIIFRDPVDRIISYFFFVKRTPAHYLYPLLNDAGISLKEYADSDLIGEQQNVFTRRFSGRSRQFVQKNPEESISTAFDIIFKRYDVIGLLDDFSSFAEKLRSQANLLYKFQNKKINATTGRPSFNQIDESVINKIAQANALDIALYKKIKAAIRKTYP